MKKYILILLVGISGTSYLSCTPELPLQQVPVEQEADKQTSYCETLARYAPSQETLKVLLVCGSVGLISGAVWAYCNDFIGDVAPSTKHVVGSLAIEMPLQHLLRYLKVNTKSRVGSAVYNLSSYASYYMNKPI